MNSLIDCQTQLGYFFNDTKLLETALIHRSFLNENKQLTESNERLEFLGDAVLELVTSDFLYRTFPSLPEGKLTNLRSKIVQTKTLCEVATRLNMGNFLKLSKGEIASGGRNNASILADLIEALIGAMYLDGGMSASQQFIKTQLLDRYEQVVVKAEVEDWKSKLQEMVQAKGGVAPTYEVVKEEGPDHDRIFTVSVHFFDTDQATGVGKSKQAAQQSSARKALEKFKTVE